MKLARFLPLIFISLILTQLFGCAAVVVTSGASVVHDRRSTGIMIDDQEIELNSIKIQTQHDEITSRSNISVTSYNLTVLMTGQAETAEVASQLATLFSRMPRVRKVHNEVMIGAEATMSDYTSDAYLTSRAKVALFDLGIPGFDPTRIKIVTSLETVYLMGLVTRKEADAVSDKVRNVSRVNRGDSDFEYID